jgi:WD40 repeat protein
VDRLVRSCLFFRFVRQFISFLCSACRNANFKAIALGLKEDSAEGNGEVFVWDMQVDGAVPNPRKLPESSGWVTSVTFSLDGRLLVSAGFNGKVLVWRTEVNPSSTNLSNSGFDFKSDVYRSGSPCFNWKQRVKFSG